MHFLDPKTNAGFQKLFDSAQHPEIVLSCLNAILENDEEGKIVSLEKIDTTKLPVPFQEEEHVVGFRCKDNNGGEYLLQVQNITSQEAAGDIPFYGGRLYMSQVEGEENVEDMLPLVMLAIVPEINVLPEAQEYKSGVEITDPETGEEIFPESALCVIELSKFNKTEAELKNDDDKWLFLLKNIGSCQNVPFALQAGDVSKACDILKNN